MAYLYVFLGGGLGSLCRYGIALLMPHAYFRLPAATMITNVLAGLLLGLIIGWAQKHHNDTPMILLGGIGFCGGFSTFSTFSLENVQLWQSGHYWSLILNIVLSVIFCFGSVLIGMKLAHSA